MANCHCSSMGNFMLNNLNIPGIPGQGYTNTAEVSQTAVPQTAEFTSKAAEIQSIPSPLLGTQVDYEAPGIFGETEAKVLPVAPTFKVPDNPLLPPGYQNILDYETLQYMTGFLRTQIGRYMRIEQLIGSDTIESRYGYLAGVGINYVLLKELATGNIMMLDFYNIKYVYIYNSENN